MREPEDVEPKIVQDWVTVSRSNTSGFLPRIQQHIDRIMDTSRYRILEVYVDQTKGDANVSLVMETTTDPRARTWKTTATVDAWTGSAIHKSFVLKREIGRTSSFLEDSFRWRLAYTSAAAWSTTFRIIAVPRA